MPFGAAEARLPLRFLQRASSVQSENRGELTFEVQQNRSGIDHSRITQFAV
jgi:hypothetical protein